MIGILKACGLFHYRRYKMEPDKIYAEINRLSLTQKLILTQDIGDLIARESGKLAMPEWQKNELEKRYDHYKQDNMKLHDWQETHNELRTRYK